MRLFLISLLAVLTLPLGVDAQTVYSRSWIVDFYSQPAPSNPPANFGRIYFDQTSQTMKCKTSTGADCWGVGSGSAPTATGVGQVQVSTGAGTTYVAQTKTSIDVRDYGVKCDGTTDDTTAMNNAFAAAVAVGTSTGTAYVKIPAGVCKGNFTITQGKGLKIEGSGELSTHLRSPNSSPALQINGLWYSSFSDMTFDIWNHNATGAVVEIDGNYDGTHTQTVQFLTFTNVLFSGIGVSDGLLSVYTVAVCRQSSGACQGSNLTFVNDAFSWASSAVYVQNGFNALSNQFIGGDFQQYTTNGIYNNGGAIQVIGTTFETAKGCAQVINGGYDINTVGGNLQSNLVYGVRSEGWQIVKGGASAPVSVDGLTQNAAFTTYLSNHAFALNTAIKQTGTDSKAHLYCATVAGTSGGSAPTWPATGTVTDGGITWTETDYDAVNFNNGAPNGSFNQADSNLDTSAKVGIGTWYAPMGSITGVTGGGAGSIGYDIAAGSNAYAEHAVVAQSIFVDLYANPNATQTSSVTGISLPGTSSGILNKTGDLWLGTGLRVSHSDGVYHFSKTIEANAITFLTDNTYDIGAAGASRPRTGYFGTSLVAPNLTLGSAPTATLATGSITNGTCAAAVTVAWTGATTASVVSWSFASDTNSTGYGFGGLLVSAYPTSGNANFRVCNPTAAPITPSAMTLNFRVIN